jgi:alpha-amylase/alpha-mannosidase (GH57 family)
MTNVAILWHMHQPYYEDLATGEHILPWVRLHGLKDYYGMVALLGEFPGLKLTFNLVPSLLVQLEAFAEERARDSHLLLGLKPAATLTEDERKRMLGEFFHAPRGRMIEPHPRYAELLRKRDNGAGFSDGDFLDLQVWHKLAWVDPLYFERDERVRRLDAKQRSFDESDKVMLHEVELEILQRIIPEYRAAAERRQAELSTSPFYHPILPLLCDTDIYLTTHPFASVPRPPFRHPEDATEQLERARRCHLRLFGRAPLGLWPSEGSVSDQIAGLAAQAGFKWMATDEAILGRTIGHDFRRDGHGRIDAADKLYRAYAIKTGSSELACLFRDHALSDLIGFVYAGWEAEAAANDFVDRLVDAGRRFSAAAGGEEATIPIILDGENAWEHFEGGGRPFLRALYRLLASHPELRTVTMTEATAKPAKTLTTIFPGSWIDANFFIWIGHQDDQRAWRQLREARQTFDIVAREVSAIDRERAHEEILIAEGSDWCWWYGDDHSSEHDLDFDNLYRRHLRNVYQMLGQAVPEELFVTNITTGAVPRAVIEPVGLIRPTLDGQSSSYFEWLAAGSVETDAPGGAMTAGDRAPILTGLLYGFDLTTLYLRLDFSRAASEMLRSGVRCTISFTVPIDRRLIVAGERNRPAVFLIQRTSDGTLEDFLTTGARAVADEILELSIPFADLGLKAKDPFSFSVSIQHEGSEVERHPPFRPVEGFVPDATFERGLWGA